MQIAPFVQSKPQLFSIQSQKNKERLQILTFMNLELGNVLDFYLKNYLL